MSKSKVRKSLEQKKYAFWVHHDTTYDIKTIDALLAEMEDDE